MSTDVEGIVWRLIAKYLKLREFLMNSNCYEVVTCHFMWFCDGMKAIQSELNVIDYSFFKYVMDMDVQFIREWIDLLMCVYSS